MATFSLQYLQMWWPKFGNCQHHIRKQAECSGQLETMIAAFAQICTADKLDFQTKGEGKEISILRIDEVHTSHLKILEENNLDNC